MAATNDARVDTTFIGYLLIGFVLLIFGVLGLQHGGLFGDLTYENYTKYPLDYSVCAQIAMIVGLMLILLTVFAYRTGKGPAAAIFAFTGIVFILFGYNEYIDGIGDVLSSNSCWFLYLAIAIFYLVFVVYAMAGKAPRFVSVLLFLMALMFFFYALTAYFGWFGQWDQDMYKAMGIVFGIFAFLGFIVATYLGLAYANPKRIPVI